MGEISLARYVRKYRANTSPRTLYGAYGIAQDVDLNPDYQRDHVWTRKQQALYIGAMIEGRCNGVIILHDDMESTPTTEWDTTRKQYTAIDGKQRLTAILAYFDNEVEATLLDGCTFFRSQLDEVSRRRSERVLCTIGTVRDMTRAEQIEYYLALNTGGTLHTPEELDRVRCLLLRSLG